jgi:hypothetical protein
MTKTAIISGLGDYYKDNLTGFSALPFIYKNIADLTGKLRTLNWYVPPAMVDFAASKESITNKLIEVINRSTNTNDWILFYYTGHASKYISPMRVSMLNITTYCVSFTSNLRYDNLPDINEFFSEFNYAEIIKLFKLKVPEGHLITILDCCYAYGMIDTFDLDEDFHTIIAASTENSAAYYDTNSIFFKAFFEYCENSFNAMEVNIKQLMNRLGSPSNCKIRVANNFTNSFLK